MCSAVAASSAEPYPAPHPASRTCLPLARRAANAYRARCSLSRSTSTSPGITRSPVNSAKLILQQRLLEGGVHFHAAGKPHVSINLPFAARHLERDRIVDPVAHLVGQQRSVGDCRGKRKGRRKQ